VGLDHFALRVPDRAAPDAWAEHLERVGVEHSGIQEENGGPLIVFRDPTTSSSKFGCSTQAW
jgi:hypothetical protein